MHHTNDSRLYASRTRTNRRNSNVDENTMKINQITEQEINEGAGEAVYIAFIDEKHVGMHVLPRWEATTDGSFAADQADKMAADNYEDIVVLKFRTGRTGFNEHYRAKAGRDVYKELGKDRD